MNPNKKHISAGDFRRTPRSDGVFWIVRMVSFFYVCLEICTSKSEKANHQHIFKIIQMHFHRFSI